MQRAGSITVVIGDFEDLLARGLRGLIEDDPSLTLVASDVKRDALPKLLRARRPRIAVIDRRSLRSPIEIRELSAEHPATRLVVLADELSLTECAQLLAFGAACCLTKTTQARDVLNAFHLASRGMQLAPRELGRRSIDYGVLTVRESDVLEQLQRRRTNAQIAADLHISVETVRTHARNIYRKLGVGSRGELVAPPG